MMSARWSIADLQRLAANGVAKVDLLGPRGTTLVTSDEIEAMAAVVALSGLLPPASERLAAGKTPEFRTTRKDRT